MSTHPLPDIVQVILLDEMSNCWVLCKLKILNCEMILHPTPWIIELLRYLEPVFRTVLIYVFRPM